MPPEKYSIYLSDMSHERTPSSARLSCVKSIQWQLLKSWSCDLSQRITLGSYSRYTFSPIVGTKWLGRQILAPDRMNLIIKHLDLNWLQVILVYNSSLSCPSESREDDPSSLSAPYCQCIYDATSFKNRLMRKVKLSLSWKKLVLSWMLQGGFWGWCNQSYLLPYVHNISGASRGHLLEKYTCLWVGIIFPQWMYNYYVCSPHWSALLKINTNGHNQHKTRCI